MFLATGVSFIFYKNMGKSEYCGANVRNDILLSIIQEVVGWSRQFGQEMKTGNTCIL